MFKIKVIKQYTLHKGERLKKRKDIEQLFKEKTSFSIPPFRVYYLFAPYTEAGEKEPPANSPLLFGVTVSKKHFKKAVDRNRIKRLIREAYRLQKLPLQETLLQTKNLCLQVFFIFTGKEMPNFEVVYQKMELVLQRMEQQARNFKI